MQSHAHIIPLPPIVFHSIVNFDKEIVANGTINAERLQHALDYIEMRIRRMVKAHNDHLEHFWRKCKFRFMRLAVLWRRYGSSVIVTVGRHWKRLRKSSERIVSVRRAIEESGVDREIEKELAEQKRLRKLTEDWKASGWAGFGTRNAARVVRPV